MSDDTAGGLCVTEPGEAVEVEPGKPKRRGRPIATEGKRIQEGFRQGAWYFGSPCGINPEHVTPGGFTKRSVRSRRCKACDSSANRPERVAERSARAAERRKARAEAKKRLELEAMKLVVAEKMEVARLKRAATLAAMEEKRLAEIAAREAHEQKYAPLRAELYRRHEWYEKVSRWPAMGVRQPVIDTEIAAETARREAFGDISVEDAEAALSKPSANDLAAALAAALKNGGQK